MIVESEKRQKPQPSKIGRPGRPKFNNKAWATRREILSEPVLIRPCDPLYPEEICTTANVSRSGLYFVTSTKHYVIGTNVLVMLNFGADDPIHREQIGDIVRIDVLSETKWGVAVRILMHNNPGIYSGT